MIRLDLEGKQFGRLTVVKRLESTQTTGGNFKTRWLCKCVCGNEKIVTTCSLTQRKVKSCGCFLKEQAVVLGFNTKHGGYSKSNPEKIRFQALKNIHERAKRRGYESDLSLDDLPILMDSCPILGIRYQKGTLKNKDFSPSIDRINPNLPYLKKYKTNLVFISHRANRIKSDSSIEELRKIIDYLESLQK